MRQRARVDDNQGEIDEALEKMGWLVWPTHQLGKGFPDRLIAKHGRVILLEVKDGKKSPSRRKLTKDEKFCHHAFYSHGVDVLIVEKVEDLMQLDREARSKYEGVPARNFYPE
jgi:hypothetical protein